MSGGEPAEITLEHGGGMRLDTAEPVAVDPALLADDFAVDRGTLERLYEQRTPLYTEVAEIVVDTDGRKVKTVVDQICRQLGVEGARP